MPRVPQPDLDRSAERARMVEIQLQRRGIGDSRVLDAMREVPRERCVPVDAQQNAYADSALPIGHGQTISQPYMVARCLELASLQPDARALEVGAGSGYQAALLARLCAHVTALERIEPLAQTARAALAALGAHNVRVVCADGSLGHAAGAPYDAIVVAAGAPRIPSALLAQLADGGRLVAPVGTRDLQVLSRVTRRGAELLHERFDACVFVPLIGADVVDVSGN